MITPEQLVISKEQAEKLKNDGVPQGITCFVWAYVIGFDQKRRCICKTPKVLLRTTNQTHEVIADAHTLGEVLALMESYRELMESQNVMDDLINQAKDIIRSN